MRQKLTTSAVKQLTPTEKPFEVVDSETKGFLLRVQPTGRMTFYFAYRNDSGKKSRIKIGSVGNISTQQARDKAIELAGQVTTGIDVQQRKKQKKAEALQSQKNTLGSFIEEHYAPWVLSNRKSGQSTLDTLKRQFGQWHSFQLNQISVLKIEQWRTMKLDEKLKPSTVNRNVATLRSVLSRAEEWGAIDYHPLARLKTLKLDNSPKVRYLTSVEEENLNQALKKRDTGIRLARNRGNEFRLKRGYAPLPSLMNLPFSDHLEPMILLSLKTGIRRGELYDILWADINMGSAILTIRAEISKSNRTRHIPLGPTALETLRHWRAQHENQKESDRVFINSQGGRFDNTNKAWRKLLKESEIENFRWHDMRHDFASKLVMKGVPLNTVRELCGHSDMNTTLRYAHLAPEHKAEAVALLG